MSDSATALLNQLHETFGDRLYNAAERLIDAGRVSDVRVLQAGCVVTGIVGAEAQADQRVGKQRVYIRCQPALVLGMQSRVRMDAECSCGERNPCVHVAAVSIAAAKSLHGVAAGNGVEGTDASRRPATRRPSVDPLPRQPTTSPTRVGVQQQCLFYLLEAPSAEGQGHGIIGQLQVSLWVGQTLAGRDRIDPESACAFAARPSDRDGGYPRYVGAQDRAILNALTMQHVNAPWSLNGELGADLLRQCLETGRACWRSLRNEPLRPGGARLLRFAWTATATGDQRLQCETADSIELLLAVEPPIYVDAARNEWGLVELTSPARTLRHFWSRSPIPPEQVDATNTEIARESGVEAFPCLRALPVQRQALGNLRARLVLTAGPEAILHFLYNGLAIDSRSLRADQRVVRQICGEKPEPLIVREIDRDLEGEQRLRARLHQALGTSMESPEAWLAFMLHGLPALSADDWDVQVQKDFPFSIATPENWYADLQSQIAQSSRPRHGDRHTEWFDLRLGVLVEGHPVNLLPALVSYLQGRLETSTAAYHRVGDHLLIRLEDGRYVPLAVERIQRIAETLVELLDDEDRLNDRHAFSLPASQASRLAQLALDMKGPVLRSNDRSMLSLIEELKEFSGIEPLTPPEHFHATLRPYQQEGLGWLQFLRRFRLGGVLADDMGLGKTVQTLAHLAIEKAQGRLRKPSLIVAPVSVIGNWQQEIQRFAPELTLLTLHGSRRKDLFAAIDTVDIVVMGYPSLQLDSEALLEREFCFLILDEAQTIKNPRAKVSQVARALRAEHRLCLTGTPMENHLGELWSLFDFLQPGFLGSESQFQRQYRGPIEKNADKKRSAALARRIAPFMLRRTKDAVARDLPEKTQIVESLELEERQRDFYDGIRLAMHRRVREVIEQQGLARSHITVLDALLKLRQACCDPRLVEDTADTRSIPSAKLDWLRTVLPELVAEGQRILLFSQFTSMLRLIEALVKELAIPYFMLTGETRERAQLVARFQALEAPLFLISLKAGGAGLNLTAADTVIHYDPWWNPAAEAQATDRAHRIGQDKPVFVYKLIAKGTVEEKIMQLQADKHALVSQLFTEQNAAPVKLSAAELESLFSP